MSLFIISLNKYNSFETSYLTTKFTTMIRIFTLIIFLVAIGSQPIFAQLEEDKVSVGNSYSLQAYYKLSTGEVTTVASEAWDIAFSSKGLQDAGVFINESASFMASPLELYLANTTDWNETIVESTIADFERLYNEDKNWEEGAFNSVRDTNSFSDYGWGKYDGASRSVVGDKIFVLKKRDGSYIKLQITGLIGTEYQFRYANLDGTEEQSETIAKNTIEDDVIIHYSLDTKETVEVPTDFDLLFQRYTVGLDGGNDEIIQYNVTGVLLAPGTEAVVVKDIDDPEKVEEADHAAFYSTNLLTIGHDWKRFDFAEGWLIDLSRVQFVKTRNGDLYRIIFDDFEGSQTGTTILFKELLQTQTSSINNELNDRYNIEVFPNPVTNYFTVNSEQLIPIHIDLIDNSGKLIKSFDTFSGQQIPVAELSNGTYHLVISNEGQNAVKTLIKLD